MAHDRSMQHEPTRDAGIATPARQAHNSEVTEDATDGRPWPIDPVRTDAHQPDSLPVPDLVGIQEATRVVAEFADSVDRSQASGSGVEQTEEVTDDDRTRYGVLLDRAAERGLLSTYEYEVRLGELATATSLERMREIVTDLPIFATPTAATAKKPARSRRSAAPRGPGSLATPEATTTVRRASRRSSPWVLLGMLLVVFVAALVFFSLYAEHLLHNHGTGMPSGSVRLILSGLRL